MNSLRRCCKPTAHCNRSRDPIDLLINWDDFLKVSDNSVDDMWEKFKLIMYDGIKQFIPTLRH